MKFRNAGTVHGPHIDFYDGEIGRRRRSVCRWFAAILPVTPNIRGQRWMPGKKSDADFDLPGIIRGLNAPELIAARRADAVRRIRSARRIGKKEGNH